MKVKLPDVTLVNIDTACHELTALAVNETLGKCEFAEVLMFSDKPPLVPGATHIHCDADSIDAALKFLWYQVPQYVKTRHFLIMQWDSWVLSPEKWSPEFLEYDYVGAPWWHMDAYNVGNGGFCLRSLELAKFVAKNPERLPYAPQEDTTLCRTYGPSLRNCGFRWPDTKEALNFAFEWVWGPEGTSYFGFHDARNIPLVLDRLNALHRLDLMKRNRYITNKAILDKTTNLITELGDRCGYLLQVQPVS